MTPWGFYTQHEPHQITVEDYMASRYVMEQLRLLDRDRPVNSCAAFVFTTSDRATDMRQPPVFVLNHAQSTPQAREHDRHPGRAPGVVPQPGAEHVGGVWIGT